MNAELTHILVLGQSNSIMGGGYVEGLRAALPRLRVTNYSVGHSVGIQFAYYGAIDFGRFDAVIFENVVNDELYADACSGIAYFASLYAELFATIAAQTRLYVLGFCARRFLHTPSDIYAMHAQLAARVGARFVSVREFVLEQGPALLGGGDADALMVDDAHPHPAITQAFGRGLAQTMRSDARQAWHPATASFAHHFAGLDASAQGARESTTRSTSFMTRRFALLRPGDALHFAEPIVPVGVYVDFNRTHGFLALSPKAHDLREEDVKDGGGTHDADRVQRLHFGMNAESMLLRFIPLVRCAAYRPVSAMTALASCDAFTDSLHTLAAPAGHATQLAIHGIACWSGTVTDLGLKSEGVSTRACTAFCVPMDGMCRLDAAQLPACFGWHPAARLEDGRWARWSGPTAWSELAFQLEAGRYTLGLEVLGAVSAEALHTLRMTVDEVDIPVQIQTHDARYEVTAQFHQGARKDVVVTLRVPATRGGYGILVSGLRIGVAAA